MPLILPAAMPRISGLRVPQDFYQVLRSPAPLAGMAYPFADLDWAELGAQGYRRVICLAGEQPGYDPSPLALSLAVQMEDLYSGLPPRDPERETGLIHQAVQATLLALQAGEGVVVHCAGGTGRTGTVLGAVLRELGYPYLEIVHYLDELTHARGRPGWPESPWQADFIKNY